jgi:uncharacterized protein YeaO (DUF488 family)
MIKLKRVYDKRSSADGVSYLVERLWPRGIKKARIAPGRLDQGRCTQYRVAKVVQSRSEKWTQFRRKYSSSSIARRKSASQSAKPRG